MLCFLCIMAHKRVLAKAQSRDKSCGVEASGGRTDSPSIKKESSSGSGSSSGGGGNHKIGSTAASKGEQQEPSSSAPSTPTSSKSMSSSSQKHKADSTEKWVSLVQLADYNKSSQNFLGTATDHKVVNQNNAMKICLLCSKERSKRRTCEIKITLKPIVSEEVMHRSLLQRSQNWRNQHQQRTVSVCLAPSHRLVTQTTWWQWLISRKKLSHWKSWWPVKISRSWRETKRWDGSPGVISINLILIVLWLQSMCYS